MLAAIMALGILYVALAVYTVIRGHAAYLPKLVPAFFIVAVSVPIVSIWILSLKADRVNTMSEDLFTMLKMESADYRLELKPLDIAELTRQICAEFYEEITKAGFAFGIEISEEPVLVNGDARLLTRVISNLLNNAKNIIRRENELILYWKSQRKRKH